MRNNALKTVAELASHDSGVMFFTADGHGLLPEVEEVLPDQFADFGIAESNMVGAAAGAASCGLMPFVYADSNFLCMRAYEFIRNDVCIANNNVKFIGIWTAMVKGTWGSSHESTEDIALLRCLENMETITCSTPNQASAVVRYAYEHNGPVYIRLENFGEREFYGKNQKFENGRAYEISGGSDLTVITTGSIISEAMDVSKEMKKLGISIRVIDMPTYKPLDLATIHHAIIETKNIITLEEHSLYGGLGSVVSEALAASKLNCNFRMMGLKGFPKGCGNQQEMREQNGLDGETLKKNIMEMLNG